MNYWRKIIAGTEFHQNRLRDERGNIIPFSRLLRNGPKAVFDSLLHRLLGRRRCLPWLSYDAQRRLAEHLGPSSRVLEFGSGLSSAWLLRRCGFLMSVEHDRGWYEKMRAILGPDHAGHLKYDLRDTGENYSRISQSDAGDGFDLILIDGLWREKCVESVIPHLRPGGILYLDNADRGWRGEGHPTGNTPLARARMLEFARQEGCIAQSYVDFVTGQFLAQEGLLVLKLPAGAAGSGKWPRRVSSPSPRTDSRDD